MPPAEQNADEELTSEEIAALSGYQPEEAALIDREFMLQRDGEPTEQREKSENPLVRLAVATLMVGGVMGLGWTVWALFFAPKPVATPVAAPTPKPTTTAVETDEAARLKAELALRNQASRTQQQPSPKSSHSPVPKPSPPTPATSPPQTQTMPEASPPRIVRETVSVPVQQPPLPLVTPIQKSGEREKPVDPLERWNQLAGLGQQTIQGREADSASLLLASAKLEGNQGATEANAPAVTPAASIAAPTSQPPVLANQPQARATAIPVVSIGSTDAATASSDIQSAGERGILNRTPVSGAADSSPATGAGSPLQVRIGTSVRGKVLVPMIWSEEDRGSQGRFAVQLSEDVLSTDNRVALPQGTVLITEVDSVAKSNRLVNQSVVAVVYPDSSGQIQQQTIPKDSILIRGADNRPLIARGMQDPGAAIARQDILVGLLGAAGQVGEIVNQPNTQSSTAVSNGGFSSQTIQTSNPRPNLLAAAVQGFFQPMSQRLSQRAEQTTQELTSRPNVAIVPQGTRVSVFFNTFFEVTR